MLGLTANFPLALGDLLHFYNSSRSITEPLFQISPLFYHASLLLSLKTRANFKNAVSQLNIMLELAPPSVSNLSFNNFECLHLGRSGQSLVGFFFKITSSFLRMKIVKKFCIETPRGILLQTFLPGPIFLKRAEMHLDQF